MNVPLCFALPRGFSVLALVLIPTRMLPVSSSSKPPAKRASKPPAKRRRANADSSGSDGEQLPDSAEEDGAGPSNGRTRQSARQVWPSVAAALCVSRLILVCLDPYLVCAEHTVLLCSILTLKYIKSFLLFDTNTDISAQTTPNTTDVQEARDAVLTVDTNTLMEMGFSRTKAREALQACGGDVHVACEWLFANCA